MQANTSINEQKQGINSINPDDMIKHITNIERQAIEANYSNNLKTVLETKEKLKERKSSSIKFSDPVLKQGENEERNSHADSGTWSQQI